MAKCQIVLTITLQALSDMVDMNNLKCVIVYITKIFVSLPFLTVSNWMPLRWTRATKANRTWVP
jgi:hypothetical protein